MSKLAKCPLCGSDPQLIHGSCCVYHCSNPRCVLLGFQAWRKPWNRLARLVRKGRMFEWLERQQYSVASNHADIVENAGHDARVGYVLGRFIDKARDWWKKHRLDGGEIEEPQPELTD